MTRVAFVSLGCAKNLVDSEKMLGQLAEAGCAITPDEQNADVIVINTCGFLEASRAEADDAMREAVALKSSAQVSRVVVAGCLVQRDGEAILQRVPGVDALVGVHRRDDIVSAVIGRQGPSRTTDLFLGEYHSYTQTDTARVRLTPRHYAYLRVSEGCDQKCTFCTIPSIRGPMHSKPMPALLHEARELIADGAFELNLIGQDTTSYGHDVDGRYHLPGLLRALNALDGVGWVRLMYVYPSVFNDDMIAAIAESEHVCKYIDMPLQHINDRVLKGMYRRVTRTQTETLLGKLRDQIPGVSIRTTMIAGFPGETEAEFDELVSFVREQRFDALGVFPYSLEKETPSGRMRDQLPDEVKQERVERLMLAQQQVAFELAAAQRGRTFDVLVDRRVKPDMVAARHHGQAPEVDSLTYVRSRDAKPGTLMTVRCTEAREYDLIASPADLPLTVL